MSALTDGALDILEGILGFLHGLFEAIGILGFGANSWGWSIIALTLIVRILLLPLAIKQTRSMRAMQAIQPQMKALQKKYKVDRELMRKDPEKYRAKKAKLNEEMMALYKEEGANPAASCLPLLAQAPIFLALFWTLNLDRREVFSGAPFYFFTDFVSAESVEEGITGLATQVSQAGWPGWLLILLMSGTMFWSQRQMMARTALTQGGGANPMAQQQKILLYAMPIFLAVISFRFPLGILLYWVTTNVWQVAQQAIILREVKSEADAGTLKDKPGGEAATDSPGAKRPSPGASSGTKPIKKKNPSGNDVGKKDGNKTGSGNDSTSSGSSKAKGKQGEGAKNKDGMNKSNPDSPAASEPETSKPKKGRAANDGTSTNGSRPKSPGSGSSKPPKRDHLPRRPRS